MRPWPVVVIVAVAFVANLLPDRGGETVAFADPPPEASPQPRQVDDPLPGVPATPAEAYRVGASFSPCDVPAGVLAGIGMEESTHGSHAGAVVNEDGTTTPPIEGVWVDGQGTAKGPMQFMDATWADVHPDGDPHNIFDAAVAAGVLLCDYGYAEDPHAALQRYSGNRTAYADDVIAYALSVAAPPSTIDVADHMQAEVDRMVADAEADGVTLTGNAWRTSEEQIAVRVRNRCAPPGGDPMDHLDAPSSICQVDPVAPLTLVDGEWISNSNHHSGEAIDFNLGNPGTFEWLVANAAEYGLCNLPSEPWHWSDDCH